MGACLEGSEFETKIFFLRLTSRNSATYLPKIFGEGRLVLFVDVHNNLVELRPHEKILINHIF